MIRKLLILSFFAVTLCAVLLIAPVAQRAASAKKIVRVMSYNIHVGVGMDKKLDLQRIADVIIQEHPDLVGLQEVDRGVKRTDGKDEMPIARRIQRWAEARFA